MSRAMDNGVRANPLLTGFYGAQHLPQHLPQQPPLPQPPLPQPPLPQQPLPQQQLPQQPPLPHFTPPPLLTGFNAAQQLPQQPQLPQLQLPQQPPPPLQQLPQQPPPPLQQQLPQPDELTDGVEEAADEVEEAALQGAIVVKRSSLAIMNDWGSNGVPSTPEDAPVGPFSGEWADVFEDIKAFLRYPNHGDGGFGIRGCGGDAAAPKTKRGELKRVSCIRGEPKTKTGLGCNCKWGAVYEDSVERKRKKNPDVRLVRGFRGGPVRGPPRSLLFHLTGLPNRNKGSGTCPYRG